MAPADATVLPQLLAAVARSGRPLNAAGSGVDLTEVVIRSESRRLAEATVERKTSVSTAVMAHPDRRHQAEQLRRRHPELDIQVVLDPDPEGRPATLRTAKLAWSKVREDATHHLVLQEDVQLAGGFAAAMHQALAVAPEGAIALFVNWVMSTSQAVRLAAFTGASWTPVVDSWVPTQALILPAALAREFAGFAERYPPDKPDNWAMAEFLEAHDLPTHAAVPNLAEHRAGDSLLLNDLLYGIRRSTVFPFGHDLGGTPFIQAVATPPAVAHLGIGDFEAVCHYEPLGKVERSTMNINEVLFPNGMTPRELEEAFASDLDYHPEALLPGFGRSMIFQLWLTMFVQGVIARGMVEPSGPEAFDKRLDVSPWARPAMGTFAAGALRKVCPPDQIGSTAEKLTPVCVSAMRTGFGAIEHWPDLRNLWDPDANAIRPRWNASVKAAL